MGDAGAMGGGGGPVGPGNRRGVGRVGSRPAVVGDLVIRVEMGTHVLLWVVC